MVITQKIKIDLAHDKMHEVIKAVQGDSARDMEITLLANGQPWSVPAGASVYVAYRNSAGENEKCLSLSDGSPVATFADNIVTLHIPPQMLLKAGKTMATVVFVAGTGHQLATFPIQVDVAKNPAVDAGEAEDFTPDQYTQLQSAITLERARINNLATLKEGSTTGDAELLDIHVGYDGTIYPSAGAAVRGQIAALHNDLSEIIQSATFRHELDAGYIVQKAFVHKNGEIQTSDDFVCTDFVDISEATEGTDIVANTTIYGNASIAFYDKDKKLLSFINGSTAVEHGYSSSKNMQEVTITKTAEMAFYRASAHIGGTYAQPSDFYYVYTIQKNALDDIKADLAQVRAEAIQGADRVNERLDTAELIPLAIEATNEYVKPDGSVKTSGSWTAYKFDATQIDKIKKLVAHTHVLAYLALACYSSETLSPDTFLGGLQFTVAGRNEFSDIAVSDYPGAKIVVVSSRTATNSEIQVSGTVNGGFEMLQESVAELKNSNTENAAKIAEISGANKYTDQLRAVYTDFDSSNDFTFVGDELWCGNINYTTGATVIERYKIENGALVHKSSINTDFGHLNTLDYDPVNDCLIFGNGANDTGTTGNWFAVVPHPLELGESATLANDAIVYHVDIGYKVQAVWGDGNCGRHNMAILFANDARAIVKVLLGKSGGEFDGTFTIVETKTLETVIGVQGADFYGDTLYIGNDTYSMACMSMTDYSVKYVTKRFFHDDGTEYTGAMQGVHIDDKHEWWFFNIGNGTGATKTLLQYCR